MQDRYLQAKALAMEALELAPGAREAWLVERCAGDAGLRAEVDWLIAAARTGPDDPLAPGWPQAGTASLQEGSRVDAAQPGQYRILRLLGEGGMGVVYLAERDDGDARQLVALKLLASAGPHGARLAQRMAEERRILATLQHPNIAHLLDGGITGDGQPFIALEYVEGERIDRWCQSRELPLRERVELFLKVCAAVEHAHQRLVVHRDLKPANILVTPQGEPKLLDFGIARLIEAHAPAEPTGTAHRALTLAYASPEHVAGKPLTTATDVWSLGIVLYELLAGARPHQAMESGHLLPDAIVSGEIRPPSSAPHTGNADTDRSARTISHAVGRIPADIDAIVLKALRHAPEDRYPSVAALSEDLRRFLDSRPVSARRGHALYRLRRFAWRQRWPLAAASVLLLLAGGFLFERERQLQQVIAERGKAQALAGFMTELFANADPSRSRGEQITVREVLDRGAANLLARNDLPAATRSDLLESVADANIGLQLGTSALPLLQEALALREASGAPSTEIAALLSRICEQQEKQGDNAIAIATCRRGQALLDPDDPAQRDLWLGLRVQELRAEDLMGARPAVDIVADLHALLPELGDSDSNHEQHGYHLNALEALANAQQRGGDLDGAIATEREAVALAERLHSDSPHVMLTMRLNLATLVTRKDAKAGIDLLRELDRDYVRLIGPSTVQRAVLLNQLSVSYIHLGDIVNGLETSQRAVDIARDTTQGDNRLYLQLAVAHAMTLGRADRRAGGIALLREVLPLLEARSAPGVDAINHAYALAALGHMLMDNDQLPAALEAFTSAERIALPHAADVMVVYYNAISGLIKARAKQGDTAAMRAVAAGYGGLLDELKLTDDAHWRRSLDKLLADLPS
ncbi:protein kinase domain-containing protein [Luteimonas sp. A611]